MAGSRVRAVSTPPTHKENGPTRPVFSSYPLCVGLLHQCGLRPTEIEHAADDLLACWPKVGKPGQCDRFNRGFHALDRFVDGRVGVADPKTRCARKGPEVRAAQPLILPIDRECKTVVFQARKD